MRNTFLPMSKKYYFYVDQYIEEIDAVVLEINNNKIQIEHQCCNTVLNWSRDSLYKKLRETSAGRLKFPKLCKFCVKEAVYGKKKQEKETNIFYKVKKNTFTQNST